MSLSYPKPIVQLKRHISVFFSYVLEKPFLVRMQRTDRDEVS